ncbi:hypothetical protein AB0C29_34185, partial [Actinoplanes sp. NPDC048791]|uniref:tetratricopeptide repeat protein n=1 Tax=Actinoplanes sp. NPDC048791 TaxID=3154623 RepID=UPI0033DE7B12
MDDGDQPDAAALQQLVAGLRQAVQRYTDTGDRAAVLAFPLVEAAATLVRHTLGPPIGADEASQREVLTVVGDLYLCRASAGSEEGDGYIDPVTAIACAVLCGREQRVLSLITDDAETAEELRSPAAWVDVAVDVPGPQRLSGTLLLRLALTALPAGDRRRAVVATNLAGGLLHAYERTGDLDLLTEADVVCTAVSLEAASADLLSNHALVLGSRFEATGELDQLDRAIAVARRATGSDEDGTTYATLGLLLRDRADRCGDADAARDSAGAHRAAVERAEPGTSTRALRLSNLASALRTGYELTGESRLLDDAITAVEEAATLTPAGSSLFPAVQTNLGVMLFADYERSADPGRLTAALAAFGMVEEADPAGEFTALAPNLALALKAQGRLGDLNSLRRAVSLCETVVARLPPGSPDRPTAVSSLLDAVLTLADHGELRAEALTAALRLAEDTLDRTPDDHADLPALLSTVSVALRTSAEWSGATEGLHRAVETARQAVDGTGPAHPDQRVYWSNLSAALLARAEHTGSATELDEAVTAGRQAVRAATEWPHSLGPAATNLGLALLTRYQRYARPQDITDAVDAARTALAVTPPEDIARPGVLSNLSLALRARCSAADDLGDLTEAVERARQAVRLTPDGHPDRPGYLSNLGLALADLADRTGDRELTGEAVRRAREALASAPPGHPGLAGYLSNLGNVLQDRYVRAGSLADLDAAIEAQRRAVEATGAGQRDRT